MVKTSEPSTTTLLDNNGDPRSHQASDDDASNANDFNKKVGEFVDPLISENFLKRNMNQG